MPSNTPCRLRRSPLLPSPRLSVRSVAAASCSRTQEWQRSTRHCIDWPLSSIAVIAAGCVVPQGMEIPPGHIAMGVGAKIVKPLPPDFWEREPHGAARYQRLAREYRASPR